jgi:uridine kinase
MKKRTVILVAGGSCSGKSVFANLFEHALILSMDHFYWGKSNMKPDAQGNYDFDAPESVDIDACAKAVQVLAEGKTATFPVYDMKTSERTGMQKRRADNGVRFIVVEGIFALYQPLRDIADLKIYLDTPTEIRVARRMVRDVEKGRSNIDTLAWSITVEKNHKAFVEPTKKYADLIIPFSYNPVQFTG